MVQARTAETTNSSSQAKLLQVYGPKRQAKELCWLSIAQCGLHRVRYTHARPLYIASLDALLKNSVQGSWLGSPLGHRSSALLVSAPGACVVHLSGPLGGVDPGLWAQRDYDLDDPLAEEGVGVVLIPGRAPTSGTIILQGGGVHLRCIWLLNRYSSNTMDPQKFVARAQHWNAITPPHDMKRSGRIS